MGFLFVGVFPHHTFFLKLGFLVWCGFLPWVRLATCPKTAVASIGFCISFCVWPTPFFSWTLSSSATSNFVHHQFLLMCVVVVWLCCGLDVLFCTCLCCCQYPIILCWEHVCQACAAWYARGNSWERLLQSRLSLYCDYGRFPGCHDRLQLE